MDDTRVGAAFRSLRLRVGWRQTDLALRAGVAQSTISDIELGRISATTINTLRRVARVLDMRVDVVVRWRGGELARLLNARHATLATAVAVHLRTLGWQVIPEVSFAIYGERGWIDILAWHEPARTLLVVEVKTELVDLHDTLGVLDRKLRLAPRVARERGWQPVTVGAWLVLGEGSTNRDRVQRFAPLLRAALPAGGRAMSAWLNQPTGPIAALTFFSNKGTGGRMYETVARRRVRLAKPRAAERGGPTKTA